MSQSKRVREANKNNQQVNTTHPKRRNT